MKYGTAAGLVVLSPVLRVCVVAVVVQQTVRVYVNCDNACVCKRYMCRGVLM